jgi:predicted ATPase
MKPPLPLDSDPTLRALPTPITPIAPVPPRVVVLTGGPGAGKTAVLEIVRHAAANDVVVLPESASIVFGGGFPRRTSPGSRAAAQRAIFHVQHELETVALDDDRTRVILCDRGTIDGLAYWPGDPDAFFRSLGSSHQAELARYHAVIHLQVPTEELGYRAVGLRVEDAAEAARIDERIAAAWAPHPRRFFVPSTANFIAKAARVMQLVSEEIALAEAAPTAESRTRCAQIPAGRS